jgi:curli biogenesis system outer membrane secretion channel CsgG
MRYAPLALLALAACQQKAEAPAKNETAAAAPTKAAAPKIQIAQKYQGEWSLDLVSCGNQTDQRLIVSADRINFYGADAPLTKLEEQPDGAVEALAHVTDNTGGYDVVNRYKLSDDGQTMTLTGAPGQPPVKLKRCPEQAA